MGRGVAAALHAAHAATYRQMGILESHAWQRAVLGGTVVSPEEAGAVQCAQFDSQGELLVAGSEEGLLTVHATAALLASCRSSSSVGGRTAAASQGSDGSSGGGVLGPGQQAVGTADPLLVLDSHMPKLQAVAWNPGNENVVGLVSSTSRTLPLYDLQHTQGRPQQVLAVPPQSAAAVGLTDLSFFGGCATAGSATASSYVVLASGSGGQVFLWDARARAAPAATLAAAQGSGALYAVQLAPDGQVVAAGSQSGEIKLWDLRGGSSSTLRFGGSVHHHPLLTSYNLRYALTAVPGLVSQTAIPASAVHSLQLDPTNCRRLGFHLGCGWSGVLDLHASAITHLHAPAHAPYEEPAGPAAGAAGEGAAFTSVAQMLLWASTAAPGLHRRATWTRDGRRFCVPSRREDSLQLLDFSPCPEAGCYALREDEPEHSGGGAPGFAGAGGEPRAAVAPAVSVALSQAGICAAAHPTADVVVAGSMNSCLSVVGLG